MHRAVHRLDYAESTLKTRLLADWGRRLGLRDRPATGQCTAPTPNSFWRALRARSRCDWMTRKLGGHADVEALLLDVTALLGEFAWGTRRLDAPCVHRPSTRHRAPAGMTPFSALHALFGLRRLSRVREVRVFSALPDRAGTR